MFLYLSHTPPIHFVNGLGLLAQEPIVTGSEYQQLGRPRLTIVLCTLLFTEKYIGTIRNKSEKHEECFFISPTENQRLRLMLGLSFSSTHISGRVAV
jgi:hypothetical protein